jgi:putative hydrolase of the HAD superfamily
MPTIRRAEETLYQWLAQHYPRITQGFDTEEIVAYRREFTAREPSYAIDMTGMRRDFLHHLGEIHDYDGEQVSENGFEVFFEARQQVEFYDDVLPCLQRLKRRFRLGAISNGNASVEHARPEEIVYVGDHPHYDVVGSIDAGYQAVWINREAISWPQQLPQPDHQISDLHQLEALLSD